MDLKTIEQNWTAASGKAVVNGKFDYFSAVCWFFGKNVYDKVRKKLASSSLLYQYSHRNAWANLHFLGQPNIFLAEGVRAGTVP